MDVPDVSLRRKSIEEMQCGNFEWYMTNVAPTHIVPYKDIISHGEVWNYLLYLVSYLLYVWTTYSVNTKTIIKHGMLSFSCIILFVVYVLFCTFCSTRIRSMCKIWECLKQTLDKTSICSSLISKLHISTIFPVTM